MDKEDKVLLMILALSIWALLITLIIIANEYRISKLQATVLNVQNNP